MLLRKVFYFAFIIDSKGKRLFSIKKNTGEQKEKFVYS